jgi:hypothetical protein
MRKLFCTLAVASLVLTRAFAAAPPPITITIKSYQALETATKTIIETVTPGGGDEAVEGLRGELGLSEIKGIDQTRPWQAVIWIESTSADPSVSVRIPVSSYADFRESLHLDEFPPDESQVRSINQVGDYAVIWIEEAGTSDAVKSAQAAWQPGQFGPLNQIVKIDITPGDALRTELLQTMGLGRMIVTGALAGLDPATMPGVNPKALGELMGFYFDTVETGITGVETLSLGLNVDKGNLMITETVSATSGSELAKWLAGSTGSLDGVLPYAASSAQASFAMRFGNNLDVMPLLKKVMGLSMQMQVGGADPQVIQETETLIDATLPVQFAGTVDFSAGINFGGAYEFPGRNANEVYALFKTYIKGPMQSQAGADKPYQEISFKEAARNVGGNSIDRVTMVFNLDAPIYQAPGQKEMIESMWKDGKLVFDYAVVGERMLVGTPESIDALLAVSGRDSVKPVLPLGKDTVAYGRVNLLELIPAFLMANPMFPEEAKEKLKNLNAAGTDVSFKVDLNGALHSETAFPLKFISAIAEAMKN